ncbi:flagellar basal-body rod protein FlgF [Sideroxydans lithotrophicus]|uniref:Flagellar basal-body rod protein FlgF n=1 Tax=Sideroxydans lithotrophicus (strain ES-1) TaxID=580332 RepID=D5CMX3_SIDLE|nr:flagellar basal-body rod protein FlgF [Sideroxydans lithotrophicus]ADE10809.1 flagellar basal-body rod protein FlgF [Sideroxydans lithotrophicus ES-1]
MDRLIYTAMTGASHTLQQQASVSQNLANINTPGFRASIDAFRSVPLVGEGLPTRTFVVDSTAGADFTPGVIQSTGRSLDVAVDGKGWIAVQDANGNEAYTRNGSFQVLPNGILQTNSGLNVMGDSGPITIPPDTEVSIAKDGTISTVPTTNQKNGVVVVGRLKLTNPPEDQLVRGEDALFRMKDGNPADADAKVTVVSGSLESSNVNMVESMVNMISLARQFDQQMKLLQTADDNAKQASSVLSVTG